MKKITTILASLILGISISGCATTNQGEYTKKWTQGAPEYIQLDKGVTVRFVRTGNGPPLVLLHTIRTQLDYFEKLIPFLSKQYQVIALDLPGHGQSSIPSEAYKEEFLRRATIEFITKLDLKDATLVGESIGGVLALTVSAELPDRVKQIVSINPYDYGEDFGGGIRRSKNGWMVGLFSIFGDHTIEPRFVTAAVLEGGFHDTTRLPEDLVTEFSRTGKRDGYRRAEHSVFKHWKTWVDARQYYSGIKTPVTLIYGSDDWSKTEEREKNQRTIAGSELITIEKSGHFTALEKPGEVANIILSKRTR